MRILGISRLSETKRIFLPKAVREELKLSEGQGLSFYIRDGKVVVVPSGGKNAVDRRGRICVPQQIVERLSLRRGDDVIFLRGEGGEVFIAKLEEVDASI